jgi:DNA-binding NtrC family response regulator
VLSLPLRGWDGDELAEELRRTAPGVPVLVRERADAATRGGVPPGLRLLAAREEAPGRREDEPWRDWLVGSSAAMGGVLRMIRLVGTRRATVLISGETGTGKELVARALHQASGRGHLPLVAVNCSALPENLLEAELFGHVKGAFTGAVGSRVGRFEQAHRSTIFLDEIADLPYDLQTKLLRVLQERELQRLGSSETVKIDVRVVAACNVDLAARVQEGKFRADLYYRLNVVPISVPPLRERREDIPALAEHFIEKICRQEGLAMRRLAPDALLRLCAYSWPGNVRQLENAVEMAVALSGDRETLYPEDFPLPAAAPAPAVWNAPGSSILVPENGLDFESVVGSLERSLLEQALQRARGNKKAAADLLRLKRTTFTAKLKSVAMSA